MPSRIDPARKIVMVLLSFLSQSAFGQTTTSIEGTVKDAQSGEPLPSANVVVVGTGFGSATDVNGRYIIRNVPPGSYNLRASYLGFKPLDLLAEVREGVDIKQDFSLEYVGTTTETILVTAQAEGQMQAINQQLTALPVMNVVSLARIQELPDANAAESVGRLPGVSLVRTGGEGSQVVIRGLSPQYNQVTINGVELPSNTADNPLTDRANDLSMISSSVLGGIEVIKAISPDMDATLIGGVVNFDLRKAAKSGSLDGSQSWFPSVELGPQSGYNNLKNSLDSYKFVGSLERRLFDESFGVFVQGSAEKRNLSANELGASYQLVDKTHGDAGLPDLVSLNLTDVFRKRERVGGTLVLDYQHETGEIDLMNFASKSDTRAISRGQSITQTSNDILYSAGDSRNTLNVLSNLLSVRQDIPLFHVDLKLSHSYSESRNPEDLSFNFWQDDAGLANRGDLSKIHPRILASYAIPSAENASLAGISTSESFSRERTVTGSLDLQTDITLSSAVTGTIKFGGMYQYRPRSYDFNSSSGSHLYSGGAQVITAFKQADSSLILNGGRLSFLNFIVDDYEYGEFLNGEYSLAYPINVDLMWRLLPIAKTTVTPEGYRRNILGSVANDYSGNEKKSAAYAMVTLHLGDAITIAPGARYQNLTTTFTALRAISVPGGGFQGRDTTVTRSHGYLLPMLHVRYKPLDWLQFHFAYTNTLNYPAYSSITPRYFISQESISYNNYRLKPVTSENFDIVVSVYTNEIGLLSINGFKKRIEDLVFFSQTYVTDFSAYPDLPRTQNQLYVFNTYINNPIAIDLLGMEAEWQTHFWFLPAPFSGVVLNVNYTHIFSEASYPRSELIIVYKGDGTFTRTVNDTSYTTRLLNQPNDLLNLTIGYDYKTFSARLSFLYQDNIFKRPDFWMQNRIHSDKFARWDLSVKQTLPWFGLEVFFNLNNLTGEDDVDLNQKTSFPASAQRYGMTADAGLRVKL